MSNQDDADKLAMSAQYGKLGARPTGIPGPLSPAEILQRIQIDQQNELGLDAAIEKAKANDRHTDFKDFDATFSASPWTEEYYNSKKVERDALHNGSGHSRIGKLNIYTCDTCRGHIVTKDVDNGTTPFMLSCKQHCNDKCNGHMQSSMYRVYDQNMRESVQFYYPEWAEYVKLPIGHRTHIQQFGLITRKAVFGE